MIEPKIEITKSEANYELIDSGEGEKLERFGEFIIRRPDPQALWSKKLPSVAWENVHAEFVRSKVNGSWKKNNEGDRTVPEKWNIKFGGLTFVIKLSPFKHTGLFPEQLSNWKWIEERIKRVNTVKGNGVPKVLNLFGYTGGATLAAANAGAEVVHVDSSKGTIAWARENATISGLGDRPIRWILDDAYKFVDKEIRRGSKYEGIIMDPPSFGHGAKGEVWKLEEKFVPLLEKTQKLLSKDALFFVVNGYAAGYSFIAYENALSPLAQNRGGTLEAGELTIEEIHSKRLLPAGIFARWSKSEM